MSTDVFFIKKRDLILKDMDDFIGDMVSSIDDERSLVMLISPNAGEERIDDSNLSPIVLWGGKGIEKGTLISSTTNRKGIISNLDIAPTIAEFLETSRDNMTGNPIESIEKEKGLEYIKSINNRIKTTSKTRSKTLLTYGIITIITLLLILIPLILNIDMNNKIGIVFKRLILLLYAMPMIFIFSSLLDIDNLIKYFISLSIFIMIFWFAVGRFNNKKKSILYIYRIFYDIFIGFNYKRKYYSLFNS